MNTDLEAVIEIAKILTSLWYDKEQPFNHQREVYSLVCRITRTLFTYTEETYERAILERDATVALCKHYEI